MKKTIQLFLFFLLSSIGFSQSNRIALLDLTTRNSESTSGNAFSAEHLLKVAGFPYLVTDSVGLATRSKFILCSSNIETTTFSDDEKDSLRAFVNKGGILFVTQLKDNSLFDLFGVSNYHYSTQHFSFYWNYNPADPAFKLLDDPNEKWIKLGDSSYTDVMGTRNYELTTATALARFDDDSAAFCMNQYGLGKTYVLGISWKDVFLRNQVMGSYNADRTYSNGFEPGSDVFILFIRSLYASEFPYSVWKHTSGLNSKASFIITHDVDATTSIRDMMGNFASYEHDNKIRATYFITTHYMHDSLAKDFWHGYTDNLKIVSQMGHEIGSHSVSHVPDFDNETIVPEGSCGEDENSYQPFYNGHFSSNVTVCGEVTVSKLLLERDLNATIRSFRSGYLAYNKKILNSLETNGYNYNSSHSANDVLTEFPFQGHLDLSMSSAPSSILEIPNTISDVFMADPISETNYDSKAAIWLDVIKRNSANFAPTVLLIHPNRVYKLVGEQHVIRSIASNIRIVPFEQFGDFWTARNQCNFDYEMENDSTLVITIHNESMPLNHELSFVVSQGMELAKIRVEDENHNEIQLLQAAWEGNDKILYSENFSPDYANFYFDPTVLGVGLPNYPNPFVNQTTFQLEIMFACNVSLKIYDVSGRLVDEPVNEHLEIGKYSYVYDNPGLKSGLYFYEYRFEGVRTQLQKMVISR